MGGRHGNEGMPHFLNSARDRGKRKGKGGGVLLTRVGAVVVDSDGGAGVHHGRHVLGDVASDERQLFQRRVHLRRVAVNVHRRLVFS